MQIVRAIPQEVNFYTLISLTDMKLLKIILDHTEVVGLDMDNPDHVKAQDYLGDFYKTVCSGIEEIGETDAPNTK